MTKIGSKKTFWVGTGVTEGERSEGVDKGKCGGVWRLIDVYCNKEL